MLLLLLSRRRWTFVSVAAVRSTHSLVTTYSKIDVCGARCLPPELERPVLSLPHTFLSQYFPLFRALSPIFKPFSSVVRCWCYRFCCAILSCPSCVFAREPRTIQPTRERAPKIRRPNTTMVQRNLAKRSQLLLPSRSSSSSSRSSGEKPSLSVHEKERDLGAVLPAGCATCMRRNLVEISGQGARGLVVTVSFSIVMGDGNVSGCACPVAREIDTVEPVSATLCFGISRASPVPLCM